MCCSHNLNFLPRHLLANFTEARRRRKRVPLISPHTLVNILVFPLQEIIGLPLSAVENTNCTYVCCIPETVLFQLRS